MSLTVSRVLLNPKVFNNGTTTKKYRYLGIYITFKIVYCSMHVNTSAITKKENIKSQLSTGVTINSTLFYTFFGCKIEH